MKTLKRIVNLLIAVSVAIILFTEIYASFNCWTLDSSILNANFKTILIVALTIRYGLIDFKNKRED